MRCLKGIERHDIDFWLPLNGRIVTTKMSVCVCVCGGGGGGQGIPVSHRYNMLVKCERTCNCYMLIYQVSYLYCIRLYTVY